MEKKELNFEELEKVNGGDLGIYQMMAADPDYNPSSPPPADKPKHELEFKKLDLGK